MLPGIESWYDLGNKSKTRRTGMDKVEQVSEHVNMILRYIPYVQTNFVLGLDSDEGAEPFELTKKFVDLSPGAFPAYSLLSAFGRAAPLNLEYQRAGRVLPFPLHFLNNNHAMNVRPKNYDWPEFYDRLVDLTTYSFSGRAIMRRAAGHAHLHPEVDERGARGLVRGLGPHQVPHHAPRAARHRPRAARLLRRRARRRSRSSTASASRGSWGTFCRVAAEGRAGARPERLPQVRGGAGADPREGRAGRAGRAGGLIDLSK